MATQQPDWYAVLGVPSTASADEIRQAFRQAALRLHPDKAGAAAASAAAGAAAGVASSGSGSSACVSAAVQAAAAAAEEYHRVQQAWEVLQDGDKRAAYDRQLALAAAAAHVHINETVPLAELAEEAVDGLPCRAWPCRCGGGYYLLDEDAQAAQAAAAADAAQAAAAGAAEARPAELVVPCSTCSLHIRVLAPPA